MSIKATIHNPKSLVSFSTENGEITLRGEVSGSQGLTIDTEVLNISTNNDLQSDSGTFQITLVDKNRWDKVLASNDFIRIQMYRDNDSSNYKNATVMIGLIDDVRRTVQIQGDTPQRVTVVTGRTFSKALVTFEIGSVQEYSVTTGTSLGWLQGRISFVGQSASQIIQQIFDELVFKYANYEFSNSTTLESNTSLKLSSRAGESLNEEKSFVNYQGSIQSFIREVANEPFNQLFWEFYDDGLATFVLRETPFNPDSWNTLPTHIIYDKDVIVDSIGRSDIETYTLYSVGLQNFFSSFDANQTMGVLPYWYEPYFKKFGLRRLQRMTGYISAVTDQADSDTSSKLLAYQNDLYNWNVHNPNFYNGYITVRGENRYKIGDRLLYLSTENNMEYEFFIESVNHEFGNFNSWVTKLGVTRGMEKGGENRFSEPWGTATNYSPGALGEPIVEEYTHTGSSTVLPFIMPNLPATGLSALVVQRARQISSTNTQYVWGGGRTESSRNAGKFDCSSFVHHAFAEVGINLGGYGYPAPGTNEFAVVGSKVSLAEARPGDIIFFNTYKTNGHMGIYTGGTKFIGCQGSIGVAEADFGSGYWKSVFSGHIRRVV